MDKNEKLFRKLSPKQRGVLETIVAAIFAGKTEALDLIRLSPTSYRVRKGNFRIIFHYESDGMPVIDRIRLRNEKTYKDI